LKESVKTLGTVVQEAEEKTSSPPTTLASPDASSSSPTATESVEETKKVEKALEDVVEAGKAYQKQQEMDTKSNGGIESETSNIVNNAVSKVVRKFQDDPTTQQALASATTKGSSSSNDSGNGIDLVKMKQTLIDMMSASLQALKDDLRIDRVIGDDAKQLEIAVATTGITLTTVTIWYRNTQLTTKEGDDNGVDDEFVDTRVEQKSRVVPKQQTQQQTQQTFPTPQASQAKQTFPKPQASQIKPKNPIPPIPKAASFPAKQKTTKIEPTMGSDTSFGSFGQAAKSAFETKSKPPTPPTKPPPFQSFKKNDEDVDDGKKNTDKSSSSSFPFAGSSNKSLEVGTSTPKPTFEKPDFGSSPSLDAFAPKPPTPTSHKDDVYTALRQERTKPATSSTSPDAGKTASSSSRQPPKSPTETQAPAGNNYFTGPSTFGSTSDAKPDESSADASSFNSYFTGPKSSVDTEKEDVSPDSSSSPSGDSMYAKLIEEQGGKAKDVVKSEGDDDDGADITSASSINGSSGTPPKSFAPFGSNTGPTSNTPKASFSPFGSNPGSPPGSTTPAQADSSTEPEPNTPKASFSPFGNNPGSPPGSTPLGQPAFNNKPEESPPKASFSPFGNNPGSPPGPPRPGGFSTKSAPAASKASFSPFGNTPGSPPGSSVPGGFKSTRSNEPPSATEPFDSSAASKPDTEESPANGSAATPSFSSFPPSTKSTDSTDDSKAEVSPFGNGPKQTFPPFGGSKNATTTASPSQPFGSTNNFTPPPTGKTAFNKSPGAPFGNQNSQAAKDDTGASSTSNDRPPFGNGNSPEPAKKNQCGGYASFTNETFYTSDVFGASISG